MFLSSLFKQMAGDIILVDPLWPLKPLISALRLQEEGAYICLYWLWRVEVHQNRISSLSINILKGKHQKRSIPSIHPVGMLLLDLHSAHFRSKDTEYRMCNIIFIKMSDERHFQKMFNHTWFHYYTSSKNPVKIPKKFGIVLGWDIGKVQFGLTVFKTCLVCMIQV